MSIQSAMAVLQERLWLLHAQGLWGFQARQFVEPSCLALMALGNQSSGELIRRLMDLQNEDGSWPAFAGDKDGCWVTALAALSLSNFDPRSETLKKAARWLLASRGREAQWLWRWKFRVIDTSVQFNPALYGWSWAPGTISWVIPTAFSILALQSMVRAGIVSDEDARPRVQTGMKMLLDRMCPSGGWNAGNRAAFGVEYAAYFDATAIALLALRENNDLPEVQKSLRWLEGRLPQCRSAYSSASCAIALAAYDRTSIGRKALLIATIQSLVDSTDDIAEGGDVATIALAVLALRATDGSNTLGGPHE